jgi:hypothetical protein
MTSDPERLLARSDGDGAFERELLSSLARRDPPEGAREEAWTGVARQIALLGVAGAGLGAAATTASAAPNVSLFGLSTATLMKLGAGVLLGAVSLGTVLVVAPGEPPLTRPAPVSLPEKAAAPVNESPPVRDAPEVAPPPPAEPATSRVTTAAERADLLSRESALLVRARSALRAGHAAEARALLANLESQFPRGVLRQEREVLNIELLAASGEHAAAARRARAFVASHPKSPHSAKLARFLNAP